MTTRTAEQQSAAMLMAAYGTRYAPKEAGNFIIDLAAKIKQERRNRPSFSPEQLSDLAVRYTAGESVNVMAKELGVANGTLTVRLRPVVDGMGGTWRNRVEGRLVQAAGRRHGVPDSLKLVEWLGERET
jgi:hypothetical protein